MTFYPHTCRCGAALLLPVDGQAVQCQCGWSLQAQVVVVAKAPEQADE